jgi:hypothetical protein
MPFRETVTKYALHILESTLSADQRETVPFTRKILRVVAYQGIGNYVKISEAYLLFLTSLRCTENFAIDPICLCMPLFEPEFAALLWYFFVITGLITFAGLLLFLFELNVVGWVKETLTVPVKEHARERRKPDANLGHRNRAA